MQEFDEGFARIPALIRQTILEDADLGVMNMQNGTEKWYVDWQSQEHAAQFDYRSVLDRRNLNRRRTPMAAFQRLLGLGAPRPPVTCKELYRESTG